MKKLLLIMIVSLIPNVVFADMIKIDKNETLDGNKNVWYQSEYYIAGLARNEQGYCEHFFSIGDRLYTTTYKNNCEEFLKQHNITSLIKIEADDVKSEEKPNILYQSKYHILGAEEKKKGQCTYYFPFTAEVLSITLKKSCEEFFKANAFLIKIEKNQIIKEKRNKAWYQSKYKIRGVGSTVGGWCLYNFDVDVGIGEHMVLRQTCEEFFYKYDELFKEHGIPFIKVEGSIFLEELKDNVYYSKHSIIGAENTEGGNCKIFTHHKEGAHQAILQPSCEEFFKEHDFMIKIEKNEFLEKQNQNAWYQSRYSIIGAENIEGGHCKLYVYYDTTSFIFPTLKTTCEKFFKKHNIQVK